MKVVLHGFGAFPVMFLHMVNAMQKMAPEIKWAIILTSEHHETLCVKALGRSNVLVLGKHQSDLSDADCRYEYPGFLYRDIDSEKRKFKFARSDVQRKRAMAMYWQARRFMSDFRPTHALVSQVEGFDGKLFIACARELGVELVVPTHCRNLGGIYFSPDDRESLPEYANPDSVAAQEKAVKFLDQFRKSPTPAANQRLSNKDPMLPDYRRGFFSRLWLAVRRVANGVEPFEWDNLRASVLNNLPKLRDAIWNARKAWNQRYCDFRSLDELPSKYVFYPLQYSPESSINTPAPYFVDQMRAIDAIRHALPSDYVLVVKEHPACILLRNGRFVRNLQNVSGVKIAHYSMPGTEVARRADLVVSVTGTATLEAFLLGRQAITLGSSLVSSALGGVCSIDELPNRIKRLLRQSVRDDEVLSYLTRLFDVRHEVNYGSPGIPGEPILRQGNIKQLAAGFLDHCQRTAVYRKIFEE